MTFTPGFRKEQNVPGRALLLPVIVLLVLGGAPAGAETCNNGNLVKPMCAAGNDVNYDDCCTGTLGTCNYNDYYADTASTLRWRISEQSADSIPGVNRWQFLSAVALATGEWNDNGNARNFLMDPGSQFSPRDDLPEFASDDAFCDDPYSLFVVRDEAGSSGWSDGACCDSNKLNCRAFLITIRLQMDGGSPRNWTVGAPQSGKYDLVSTLTHELGHAAGLKHGPCGEAAVMMKTWPGNTRRRHLYEWDLNCLREMNGFDNHRSNFAVSVYRAYGGSQAGPWDLLYPAGDVSIGTTWHENHFDPSWAAVDQSCVRWIRLDEPGVGKCIPAYSLSSSIGPVNSVWRDRDKNMQRVFYSYYRDWDRDGDTYGFCELDASHQVKYFRSDDEFLSATSGTMSACTTMNGWFSCDASSREILTSAYRVSVAWLDGYISSAHPGGVTVFSWLHQNRLDDADDYGVRISIGNMANHVLPQPTKHWKSSVGPAVACKNNFTGSLDCMLAYVPFNSTYNTVRVRRFRVEQDSARYIPVFIDANDIGTAVGSPVRTGQAIAAAYQNTSSGGRFVVSVVPQRPGQLIEVYTSPDAQTWTREYPDVGSAITAPSLPATEHAGSIEYSFTR